MKAIRSIIICISLIASLASCFGIKPENYPELSPVNIVSLSDTINADLGVELHYEGITIESDLPVNIEWAYGEPEKNTTIEQHRFASRTVLETTSSAIDYTFTKLGSFILRMRVDNGESVAYKFFRLNVNSGLDEGVAILDNDSEDNTSIVFLKTLTAEEAARGDQELFTVIPAEGMRCGRALYMSSYNVSSMKSEQAGFVVATTDESGTVYLFAPKTFELVMSDKMAAWGTEFSGFSGEYGGAHDFGVFFNGADGRIFRFDLILGYLNDITNFPEGLTHSYAARTRSFVTASTSNYPFFFNDELIATRTTVSSGVKIYRQEGYRIVNLAAARTSSNTYPVYVILQSESDPSSYRIQRIYLKSGGSMTWATEPDESGVERVSHYDFTSQALKMDGRSKMVNTKKSNDVYYSFSNAVYRWSLSAPPGNVPAITLPPGEEIRDMCVNYMGPYAAKDNLDPGEDLLYILTYNPGRPGDNKGSLYIYRISDDSMVRSMEGICKNPVSVIYKYRLS